MPSNPFPEDCFFTEASAVSLRWLSSGQWSARSTNPPPHGSLREDLESGTARWTLNVGRSTLPDDFTNANCARVSYARGMGTAHGHLAFMAATRRDQFSRVV